MPFYSEISSLFVIFGG